MFKAVWHRLLMKIILFSIWYKIFKIKLILIDLILFFLFKHKISIFAKKSLLNATGNSTRECPLCGKEMIRWLIDLPIGWPVPQKEHLLFFDYQQDGFATIIKNRRFIERTLGFYANLNWSFCLSCNNASLKVNFDQAHIDEYYSIYYNRKPALSSKRRNTKEIHAKFIDSLVQPKSAILEFGCGDGYAAKYLAKSGHNVCVFEPSSFRRNLKLLEALTVSSDIEELEENSFDCIYLHHVLEHIVDINGFFIHCRRMLRNKGLLIIQVPDLSMQMRVYLKSLRFCHYRISNRFRYNRELIYSDFFENSDNFYWIDALINNHVYAFSCNGLEQVLKSNGFDLIYKQQTTRGRLIFNPDIYTWPVDRENGQTPNGVTVAAVKGNS